MLKLLYSLIHDYGVFGLQLAQFGVIIYCFWKLFTNHLHHMDIKIDGVVSNVNNLKKEVSNDRKATNRLSNRISKIEGKLEERDVNKLSTKKKTRRKK